jgi:uncharacterized protein YcgI (DUF1989 family)
VLDVNLWHAHDPRERFWPARTRQFHGAHVSVGDRLWSSLPFLRPPATIVADTIDSGIDADGAGCHDLLGTRCDPYVNQMLSGTATTSTATPTSSGRSFRSASPRATCTTSSTSSR